MGPKKMMAMMKIMITNNIIMKKTTNGSSGGASAVGMAMMTLRRFNPKRCRRNVVEFPLQI